MAELVISSVATATKAIMQTPKAFVIVRDPDRVQAWSALRLPFEPQGVQRDLRDELRVALKALRINDSQLLHAVYSSADKRFCDVENILLYNVGMSAFRANMNAGIQLERSFSPPDGKRHAHAGEHHHAYSAVALDAGFQHWVSVELLAEKSDAVSPSRMASPAAWWLATRVAGGHERDASYAGRFGIDIVWCPPRSTRSGLSSVLKPMLDGVIAAFHRHDGSTLDELAQRLGTSLERDPEDTARLLTEGSPALERRRLLWPYRTGVQWNPADDRCVAVRVRVAQPRSESTFGVRLMAVRSTEAEPGESR